LPFSELAQNGVVEGGLERQLLLEGVHARLAQVADPLQGAAQNPAQNIQFIPDLRFFASSKFDVESNLSHWIHGFLLLSIFLIY
jgi:hypothetical protein